MAKAAELLGDRARIQVQPHRLESALLTIPIAETMTAAAVEGTTQAACFSL